MWTLSQSGWRVAIATVFTGNVEQPSGFALACQLDKGLPADVDYMALRREEDRQACAALGAEPRHLPLLQAPHRGYDSAAALFDRVLSGDQADGQVRTEFIDLLEEIRPDVVLAPLAIGGHVDHVIVRRSVEEIIDAKRLWLWEDWPYVDRIGSPDRKIEQSVPISAKARAAKTQACTRYVSQLGFQFGGAKALADRLSAQTEEWFVPAGPTAQCSLSDLRKAPVSGSNA